MGETNKHISHNGFFNSLKKNTKDGLLYKVYKDTNECSDFSLHRIGEYKWNLVMKKC